MVVTEPDYEFAASREPLPWASVVFLAMIISCVTIPLVILAPLPLIAAAAVALGVIIAVFVYPPLAAYLLIILTPLLAGLGRGWVIPVFRPYEVLAALVGTALVLKGAAGLARRRSERPKLGSLDSAIVLMSLAGSLLPLLWLFARGQSPSTDDVLYAATFWKFYAVFLIVRLSVRTDRHVQRCLWLSMASGSVVAVVAVLQSLQLFGVVHLVAAIYPPDDTGGLALGRGTSTVGSSIAVGDIMAFNLAIALGWLLRAPHSPRRLLPLAVLFLAGGLASGQFSAAISLAVVVAVVAALTGRLRQLVAFVVPAVLVAFVVLRPVIGQRLIGFDSTTGLPQSWDVRLVNLSTYFWPELFSRHSYLLGVRPAARVLTPESWGPYVYIESGYTWLLWVGGLPLLAAYGVFVIVAVRRALHAARSAADGRAAAGIAACAALSSTVILMAFDPHLVMRGAGDLLFTLLALVSASAAWGSAPSPVLAGDDSPTEGSDDDRPPRTSGTDPAADLRAGREKD